MISIEDVKQLELKITWKFLYVCICEKQMLIETVIEYAMNKIEEGDERIEIFELAGAYIGEKEYICDLILRLGQNEESSLEFEKRKLRVILVKKVLEYKNDNYIDGLMDLTDLWIGLGYPQDSPHILQGIGNNIAIKDYYTQEYYDFLYQRNVTWLKNEVRSIINNQK